MKLSEYLISEHFGAKKKNFFFGYSNTTPGKLV